MSDTIWRRNISSAERAKRRRSVGVLTSLGHRLQFPILITYQYACGVKVIRLLQQRSLENSSTVLQKKMSKQHSEKWLQRSHSVFNGVQVLQRITSQVLQRLYSTFRRASPVCSSSQVQVVPNCLLP